MPEHSYGLLLYRRSEKGLEVFLCHHGGPYFAGKDKGWWSIPKGLAEAGEAPLETALREFTEEIGFTPDGEYISLGTVKQKGGKIVEAWAVKDSRTADWQFHCTSFFDIEWPPRSGQMRSFPEIDKADFFPLEVAREKINEAQKEFLKRLEENLR